MYVILLFFIPRAYSLYGDSYVSGSTIPGKESHIFWYKSVTFGALIFLTQNSM